eukprot:8159338-Alexandrium_andersonii.AAC.1
MRSPNPRKSKLEASHLASCNPGTLYTLMPGLRPQRKHAHAYASHWRPRGGPTGSPARGLLSASTEPAACLLYTSPSPRD